MNIYYHAKQAVSKIENICVILTIYIIYATIFASNLNPRECLSWPPSTPCLWTSSASKGAGCVSATGRRVMSGRIPHSKRQLPQTASRCKCQWTAPTCLSATKMAASSPPSPVRSWWARCTGASWAEKPGPSKRTPTLAALITVKVVSPYWKSLAQLQLGGFLF